MDFGSCPIHFYQYVCDVKLDSFNETFIPDDKLLDYCLNPNHPDGKHKARVLNLP